jgi:hypothetical protein
MEFALSVLLELFTTLLLEYAKPVDKIKTGTGLPVFVSTTFTD